jgi:signal transduction histidine kinase
MENLQNFTICGIIFSKKELKMKVLGKLFKQTEAENYKDVLRMLPDAVFIVELTGEISWVNLRAVTLFETYRKPLIGSFFDEIVADGLLLARKSYDEEKTVATGAFSRNDAEIFVELSAAVHDDQYYVTVRDITTLTELLNLAENTGKLNKEKNYMLCKLSNDIKSPLQSISGFSQALLDGLGGELNEKQSKYIKIINKNSVELAHFLDKLLEFSLVESTMYKLDYRNFDIINTVQNVIKTATLSSNTQEINVDTDTLLKKIVYSDENAIKIVLQNLIDTMLKMSETGMIEIKIANPEGEDTDKCQIMVSGVGIGLSEIEKASLFNPYALLEKSNKKGLLRSISLASVEMLVKKLGGSVWVETNTAYGTAFNVSFPGGKG